MIVRPGPLMGSTDQYPGATFYQNFAAPGASLGGWTFARTSAANRNGADGDLILAATGVPRLPDHVYNGTVWVPKGYRGEGARTNLALHSSRMDNAAWAVTGSASKSAQDGPAPDGSNDACLVTFTASGETIQQSVGGLTASSTYTWSVWVQWVSGPTTIELGGLAAGDHVSYDITGTITRLTFVQAASATTRFPQIRSTGAGTIRVWGGMLELGSFASSYIATTTATVTRNADSAERDATLPGTVVIRGRTASGSGSINQRILQLDDGTSNERVLIDRDSSDRIVVTVVDGGVTQTSLTLSTVADDTDFAVAVRVQANNVAASLDGGAVSVDTSATLPTVTTERLGSSTSGIEWYGTIASLTEWPAGVYLDDSALRALAA